MSRELDIQLAGLKHGDHLCMIHETDADQLAALVPFLRDGLSHDEKCYCAAEGPTLARLTAALTDAGVDVPGAVERGSLLLVSEMKGDTVSGRPNLDQAVERVAEECRRVLREGFTGLRIAGDATWVLGREVDLQSLTRYEAMLNDGLRGMPTVLLCQYHRDRFAPAVYHQILKTHPVAILGDKVCPNLFYEPSSLLMAEEAVARRVDWMMRQLQRAREAELTLEERAQLLEARVAERTAALAEELERRQRAEEERAALTEMRDEYISLISHDLRNPLTAVMGQGQFLQRQLSQLGLQQEAHTAGVIVRNAKRMGAMLEDLMESVRLESSEVDLRVEQCDLVRLVSNAIDQLTSTESRTRIEVRPIRSLPLVQADPERLERAVMNLITNALKYSPTGSPVVVQMDRGNSEVIISVSDRGGGIPPEAMPHLFQRFYRVQGGRVSEGLGLGLYITRLIAEAHGGRVWVESELGNGSSFYLALPIDTTTTIP